MRVCWTCNLSRVSLLLSLAATACGCATSADSFSPLVALGLTRPQPASVERLAEIAQIYEKHGQVDRARKVYAQALASSATVENRTLIETQLARLENESPDGSRRPNASENSPAAIAGSKPEKSHTRPAALTKVKEIATVDESTPETAPDLKQSEKSRSASENDHQTEKSPVWTVAAAPRVEHVDSDEQYETASRRAAVEKPEPIVATKSMVVDKALVADINENDVESVADASKAQQSDRDEFRSGWRAARDESFNAAATPDDVPGLHIDSPRLHQKTAFEADDQLIEAEEYFCSSTHSGFGFSEDATTTVSEIVAPCPLVHTSDNLTGAETASEDHCWTISSIAVQGRELHPLQAMSELLSFLYQQGNERELTDEQIQLIEQHLRHDNPLVSLISAEALLRHGCCEAEAIDVVIGSLHSPSEEVRLLAVHIIGPNERFDFPAASDLLLAKAISDSTSVRRLAILELGGLPQPSTEVIQQLKGFILEEESEPIRHAAAISLRAIAELAPEPASLAVMK